MSDFEKAQVSINMSVSERLEFLEKTVESLMKE